MTMITDSPTTPLRTDADISDRVGDVVGSASARRLSLLFLDEHDVQLPFIFPIHGHPVAPREESASLLLRVIGTVLAESPATQVVAVWERPRDERPRPADLRWARLLSELCRLHGFRLRAQLLSHLSGVCFLRPDAEGPAG